MRRDTGIGSPASPTRLPFVWGLGAILSVVALNLAPAKVLEALRSTVRDGLAPGQSFVQQSLVSAGALWLPGPAPAGDAPRDRGDLAALEERNRQLELELADLRERLTIAEEFGRRPRPQSGRPLLIPELIEARWLGEEIATQIRTKGLLSAGSRQGLSESALVLQSERSLIDLGESGRLSPGDAVYAGRIVVGKIAEVGRWTSTVRRVTDADYSDRVRVARRTDAGLQVIAEGTLVGNGSEGCLLHHVTEPVAEGDEVFTSGTDGIVRLPMYYGRVTAASLEPGAREWTVTVAPAAAASRRQEIQVLRLTPNRDRLLGN